MSPFEVIKIPGGWGVFGFDPYNPNDKVLANIFEYQVDAEMLASELDRVTGIKPAPQPAARPSDVEEDDDKKQIIRGINFDD
jgi:hypothetical protein